MAAAHLNNAKNFNNRAVKNDVMSLPNCGDISTWVGLITRWCPPLAAANFLTSHNSPSHCWNRHVEKNGRKMLLTTSASTRLPLCSKTYIQKSFQERFCQFSSREILNRKEGVVVVHSRFLRQLLHACGVPTVTTTLGRGRVIRR